MTPRSVLLDTVFLQARYNRLDPYHARAEAWAPLLRVMTEVWITEAVLIELANAMSAANRAWAWQFIESAYKTANIRVVPVETQLFHRGLDLYRRRADKQWGLTDCISFVVMSENGLSDALTADRHFVQAGFNALLLQDPPPAP